jgi:hypothetical protein
LESYEIVRSDWLLALVGPYRKNYALGLENSPCPKALVRTIKALGNVFLFMDLLAGK